MNLNTRRTQDRTIFRMKAFATLFSAVLLGASAFAGPGTIPSFTTIDNSGVITGNFGSGAAGHPNQGYTIASPYAIFLPDNLPASMQTQATRIANHGNTVGFWSPTTVRVSVAAPVGKVRGGTRGRERICVPVPFV